MKRKSSGKMVSVPESVLREVFKQEREGQISYNCDLGSGAMDRLREAVGLGEEREYISLQVAFDEDLEFAPDEDPDDTSTYVVKVYSKKGGELLFEGKPVYVNNTY